MAFFEMLPGAGMPSGLQAGMDSVLNKKFGTSTTYPAEGWPDNVNLMGPLPEKTVSGAIVTFADGADAVPLKKCEVSLSASLDGYSEVDVVHCGKNLMSAPTYMASSDTLCLDLGHNMTFDSLTLSFLATNSEVDTITSALVDYREDDGTHHYRTLNDFTDSNNVRFSASSPNNGVFKNTYSNITFRYVYVSYMSASRSKFTSDSLSNWQLEVGSSATSYEPYTAPTTHTADLGRTIYGGSVDVVNGTGTDENRKFTVTSDMSISYKGSGDTAYIQIDSSPASNNRWQDLACSHFTPANIYAGGTQQGIGCYSTQFYIRDSRFESKQDFLDFLAEQESLGTPLEICYKKATPETFTFEPVPIDSKLGNNTLWAEQGDAEVTYRADIALALGE